MMSTAPRWSTTATVSRNKRNGGGTRPPSRPITPIAKAMSVAAGMAQPHCNVGSPPAMLKKMSAGNSIPATAARTGKRRCRASDRFPATNSRFASSPTTKKKIAHQGIVDPQVQVVELGKWCPGKGSVEQLVIFVGQGAVGGHHREHCHRDQQDAFARVTDEQGLEGPHRYLEQGSRGWGAGSVIGVFLRRRADGFQPSCCRCEFLLVVLAHLLYSGAVIAIGYTPLGVALVERELLLFAGIFFLLGRSTNLHGFHLDRIATDGPGANPFHLAKGCPQYATGGNCRDSVPSGGKSGSPFARWSTCLLMAAAGFGSLCRGLP